MISTCVNYKTGDPNGAKAVTTLQGFAFNSYCNFNGRILGAADDGLYEIGGEDASSLESSLKTFNSTLGSSGVSRPRFLYFGVETAGTLNVLIYADDTLVQTLVIEPNKSGRQYIKVKAGRGSRGSYWSFKIVNTDNCWFSIDTIKALPLYLSPGRE